MTLSHRLGTAGKAQVRVNVMHEETSLICKLHVDFQSQ